MGPTTREQIRVRLPLFVLGVIAVLDLLLREIVLEAFEICGIAGYRNNSDFTLGRLLRDAMSASLMISNDRIRSGNAAMHLVHKGGAIRGLSEGRA